MFAKPIIGCVLMFAAILCGSTLTLAGDNPLTPAGRQTAAMRVAGGGLSANANDAQRLHFLVCRHAASISEILNEELPPLSGVNFRSLLRPITPSPSDCGGRLQFPASLVSESPSSSLGAATAALQSAFNGLVERVHGAQPIPVEVRRRVETEIDRMSVQVDKHDVSSVLFLKRLRKFVAELTAASVSRDSSLAATLLCGGERLAPSFAGGSGSEFLEWIFEHKLVPATGSQGSRYLTRVAQIVCTADREEQQRSIAEKVAAVQKQRNLVQAKRELQNVSAMAAWERKLAVAAMAQPMTPVVQSNSGNSGVRNSASTYSGSTYYYRWHSVPTYPNRTSSAPYTTTTHLRTR